MDNITREQIHQLLTESDKELAKMSTDEKLKSIKDSLQKQYIENLKYGFDIKKHWQDMLATIDNE